MLYFNFILIPILLLNKFKLVKKKKKNKPSLHICSEIIKRLINNIFSKTFDKPTHD